NAAPLPDKGGAYFSRTNLKTTILYENTVVDMGELRQHQFFTVRIFQQIKGLFISKGVVGGVEPLFKYLDIAEYFHPLTGYLGQFHDLFGMKCFKIAVFHLITVEGFGRKFKDIGPFIFGEWRNALYMLEKPIGYTPLDYRGHQQPIGKQIVKSSGIRV